MSALSPRDMGPCPRCGGNFTGFPALSRLDNLTYICSPCGTAEAMWNFADPGKPLPPFALKGAAEVQARMRAEAAE